MLKSETIGELAKALAIAQGEIQNAKKDSENPFFRSKYSDLAAVREAYQGPLSRNGLALIQTPKTLFTEDGLVVSVESLLCHASGEWISEELSAVPVKTDPQGIGSCITYLRRYSAGAITGVASEDDDGNAASQPDKTPAKSQARPTQKSVEKAELRNALVGVCKLLNAAGDNDPVWGEKRLNAYTVQEFGVKADDLELEPLRDCLKRLTLRLDEFKKAKKPSAKIVEDAEKIKRIDSLRKNSQQLIENAFERLKMEAKPLEQLSLDSLIALDEELSVPF